MSDINPTEWYDTREAVAALSHHLGQPIKRVTMIAWVNRLYLPAIRKYGMVYVPKMAIPLFERPTAGSYARRVNLAAGVKRWLDVMGYCDVPLDDKQGSGGVVGAACPRCGSPYVVNGRMPKVVGCEADLVCAMCGYIGADFIAKTDPRVMYADGIVHYRK